MPENIEITNSPEFLTEGSTNLYEFGWIEYTVPGTYRYKITESVGSLDGITYDDTEFELVVVVTDNGDGTLSAEANYNTENPMAFVNEGQPVKTTLEANKSLVGRKLREGEFTFELKDSAGNVIETRANDAAGAVKFLTELEYEKAGTYTYTISEVIPENPDSHIYYSDEIITVTVLVEDTGDGPLKVTVTYEGGTGDASNTIMNEYTPDPIEANLSAMKILIVPDYLDRELNAGEFTFKLIPGTATYTPEGGNAVIEPEEETTEEETTEEETTEAVEEATEAAIEAAIEVVAAPMAEPETGTSPMPANDTAVNDGYGLVNFETITFDRAGVYEYTIVEVKGDLGGIIYAENEISVKVYVSYSEDTGLFTVDDIVYDPEYPNFVNSYEVEDVSIIPETTKILSVDEVFNRELQEGEFEFLITGTSENTEGYTDTARNAADGSVIFDAITYDKPGTYEYEITEIAGELGGITYADNTVKVTVVVTDDLNGKLVAEVTYDPEANEFINEYVPEPITAVIEAKKVLNGRELKEGQFVFTLLDPDGELVDTKTNAADGTVTFDEIEFDTPGTYEYRINEVIAGDPGYAYDSATITATVTVVDNSDGTMTATVTYDPEEATFTNTYTASAEAEIKVVKKLNGKTLAVGEFTFELKDEDGKLIESKKNDADGNVEFSKIKFTEADAGKTFTFKITEKNEGKANYIYDTKTITVTVKVSDNGDGTLELKVTYSDDTFVNTYVSTPDTGDHNNTTLLMAVMILALINVLAITFRRKRDFR